MSEKEEDEDMKRYLPLEGLIQLVVDERSVYGTREFIVSIEVHDERENIDLVLKIFEWRDDEVKCYTMTNQIHHGCKCEEYGSARLGQALPDIVEAFKDGEVEVNFDEPPIAKPGHNLSFKAPNGETHRAHGGYEEEVATPEEMWDVMMKLNHDHSWQVLLVFRWVTHHAIVIHLDDITGITKEADSIQRRLSKLTRKLRGTVAPVHDPGPSAGSSKRKAGTGEVNPSGDHKDGTQNGARKNHSKVILVGSSP